MKIGKSLGNLGIKAATSAIGAYFGGPAGAAAGYSQGENIAGVVGLGQDQLNAEYELAMNKKLADYKYQKDLNMWNLQNAYNDPSQQMARLQAAGLNPNLVYGGGNVTGNTTSNYPTYDSPDFKYTDRSVQRAQLQLAMEEHQQRITNQAIENDLARQRIGLAAREADRSDALARAQIRAINYNMAPGDVNPSNLPPDRRSWLGKIIDDISDKLYPKAVEGGEKFFNWNEEKGYNKKASQYKNSNLHKFSEFIRNF